MCVVNLSLPALLHDKIVMSKGKALYVQPPSSVTEGALPIKRSLGKVERIRGITTDVQGKPNVQNTSLTVNVTVRTVFVVGNIPTVKKQVEGLQNY